MRLLHLQTNAKSSLLLLIGVLHRLPSDKVSRAHPASKHLKGRDRGYLTAAYHFPCAASPDLVLADQLRHLAQRTNSQLPV